MRVTRDARTAIFDAFYGPKPPTHLGVAVSGGSDSLALLHLLADWGAPRLSAVTVNHGLRPEAASEALHVERICETLGVPHAILEWKGWDGKGNLQDQARRTRYALMAEWGRARGLDAIALGHTQDDVAETFLMRLSRTAGLDGLAAMAPRFDADGVAFHRPLLEASRADLREFLTARGVRWVDDPSNTDENFDRVKARTALDALAPLGITAETVAHTARHLASSRAALSHIAADWAGKHVRQVSADLVLDRTALLSLPGDLIRRILSGALRYVASAEYAPRSGPLAAVVTAIRAGDNATLHGCRILVSAMTVRVIREFSAVSDLKSPTNASWDRRWQIDGPHNADLEIRALGDAIRDCPTWPETKLPRATLLASPAVFRGDTLVAAPTAGLPNGWTAHVRDRSSFPAFLVSH